MWFSDSKFRQVSALFLLFAVISSCKSNRVPTNVVLTDEISSAMCISESKIQHGYTLKKDPAFAMGNDSGSGSANGEPSATPTVTPTPGVQSSGEAIDIFVQRKITLPSVNEGGGCITRAYILPIPKKGGASPLERGSSITLSRLPLEFERSDNKKREKLKIAPAQDSFYQVDPDSAFEFAEKPVAHMYLPRKSGEPLSSQDLVVLKFDSAVSPRDVQENTIVCDVTGEVGGGSRNNDDRDCPSGVAIHSIVRLASRLAVEEDGPYKNNISEPYDTYVVTAPYRPSNQPNEIRKFTIAFRNPNFKLLDYSNYEVANVKPLDESSAVCIALGLDNQSGKCPRGTSYTFFDFNDDKTQTTSTATSTPPRG